MKQNLDKIKKLSVFNYEKLLSHQTESENIDVMETRNASQTIKVLAPDSGREVFIHSKYDPISEAERFIEQNSSYIAENNHVLFYGVGLGYHIDAFKKAYPDKFWSIYEPDINIFKVLVEARDLSRFFNRYFKFMNIETSDVDRQNFLNAFTENIHDGVAILTLPSYDNIYKEKKIDFDKDFVSSLQLRRMGINVEAAFAKRWVINSLQNLLTTYQSEDILQDYKEVFRNKPIIIVSAGPSLKFEYDNLRKIKDEGLAYVFAVGSANKALIANDIYPDVVCTYDPKKTNYRIFAPMYEAGIDSVPMFYGSSVGFETLMEYKGPKAHMLTSQDTVSAFYLGRKDKKELELINDAPTIAVVTLQLAIRLEASQIYLVGQNLAYLDNLRYAEAVHQQYAELAQKQEQDLKEKETVIDVYGKEIATSMPFSLMREEMEAYLKLYEKDNVFNTTKGGAAIEGAPFVSLDDVIEKELKERVVDEDWFEESKKQVYDSKHLLKRIGDMDYSIRRGRRQLKEITDLIENIYKNYKTSNTKNLRRLFIDFDKALNKFQNLDIWKVYIERIVRVYTENINKKSHEIVATDDFIERARLFTEFFPAYVLQIKLILEELAPVIKDNHLKLERLLVQSKAESNLAEKDDPKGKNIGKLYLSNSRIIKYEGNWQDHNYLPTDSNIYELGERFSSEKGAKASFRFTGSSLKIYSSKREDRSENIKISVNGVEHKVSQKDYNISLSETPDIWSEIFAIENSDDGKTNLDKIGIEDIEGRENSRSILCDSQLVEIELLDDDIMSIIAIEIDDKGILLHSDEVSSVEELEIGKRIRCHYKADAGQVGTFSQLGFKPENDWQDNRDNFISPKSSAIPDGYFYFIMVDCDEEGRKVLVADRNIQHSISLDTLNVADLVQGTDMNIEEEQVFTRLIDGGQAHMGSDGEPSKINVELGVWPEENEWDIYIKEKFIFNIEEIGSWTKKKSYFHNKNDLVNDRFVVRGEIIHDHKVLEFSSLSSYYYFPNRGYRPLLILTTK